MKRYIDLARILQGPHRLPPRRKSRIFRRSSERGPGSRVAEAALECPARWAHFRPARLVYTFPGHPDYMHLEAMCGSGLTVVARGIAAGGEDGTKAGQLLLLGRLSRAGFAPMSEADTKLWLDSQFDSESIRPA